ncbi:MAG: ribosome-associated translation inhibitor RaiA [Lachnospiraceae bacterium]|nr:ribosome-associated translation inhibitor RaiA [Lachnospiraceae bacterium]
MIIKITSKDLEISPAMEELLTKKLSRLEKFFDEDTRVYTHLSATRAAQKIEVTIPVRNGTIRCEQEDKNDIYNTFDRVVEALESQIRKYRGKLQKFYHSGAGRSYYPEADEADDAIRIVKTKRFAVKPMSAEEACLQMELLGHNFYVFLNAETDEVNVVYRRNSSDYGLIEPILDDED